MRCSQGYPHGCRTKPVEPVSNHQHSSSGYTMVHLSLPCHAVLALCARPAGRDTAGHRSLPRRAATPRSGEGSRCRSGESSWKAESHPRSGSEQLQRSVQRFGSSEFLQSHPKQKWHRIFAVWCTPLNQSAKRPMRCASVLGSIAPGLSAGYPVLTNSSHHHHPTAPKKSTAKGQESGGY